MKLKDYFPHLKACYFALIQNKENLSLFICDINTHFFFEIPKSQLCNCILVTLTDIQCGLQMKTQGSHKLINLERNNCQNHTLPLCLT